MPCGARRARGLEHHTYPFSAAHRRSLFSVRALVRLHPTALNEELEGGVDLAAVEVGDPPIRPIDRRSAAPAAPPPL